MKFRADKDVLQFLAMSLGLVAIGALLWIFYNPIFGAGLILGGTIMTITGLYAATKPKDQLLADERTARINEKAGLHAFEIMLTTSVIITLIDLAASSPIKYQAGVVPAQIAGIYSYIILQWYYNKKGDIE
ncbi:MAG: DUF2178 domain-containing protein [Candidatus Methanoperedens sp.]|nr:DUF2178 domain-containing protein [Candidatus Methanoperedens sp.]MCZ7371516.1 DUF2178 domain-containing protein [Candidatus Methanoperedens sp.]